VRVSEPTALDYPANDPCFERVSTMQPHMPETSYWRVHVRVDEDPLSTLTVTRAAEGDEEPADIGAEALRAYRELVGLPEDRTVHVEVAPLTGPENPQDSAPAP